MATARGRLSVGRKPALGYEVRRIRDDSSNPTTSAAKPPVFPGNTRVSRRLWRLTGRLTRGQGSAQDDAACASMHVHGRAGKPKQLARNAKNPGKTRVLQRRGQEPNNLQIPWETHTSTPRATRNTTRADFIVCDDSKHYPSRPTCNFFAARFTGSRIQDRSKFTGSWFSVCRVIYRVTSKTPENLQGHSRRYALQQHQKYYFPKIISYQLN